ncbi:alkaline phosphatase family protein [Mucilaginibacter segetis]|uniref:Alkaline phosphatase family protein n=1 Tax=Mucilaginibacter segetis TaxID=2793071 RepID=A0A934PPR2_9SPHI|nr:ectonucleotide pyrophosphatase/phosphodiesterase [Mucilaginibacter segetis]MBK0378468.1 alkaline phosphatase family protein [Mucilaginibacter segetis]
MIKKQTLIASLMLLCMGCINNAFGQLDTLQRIVPGRTNSAAQLKKPYIILISADGFRWDYAHKYHAKNLLALAKQGVEAESMLPSFPASTHANHFTLVSGLYPAHSGIVGNDFYDANRKEKFKPSDGTWFGEEPIWVTAEKQQLLTASFYWIDTQAPVKGIRPTYYYKPNKGKEIFVKDRVNAIRNWLNMPEDKRPHFIACYFPNADHAGHKFGPESAEVEEAVAFVDDAVGQMVDAVKETGLPVNFIFVSDHGMTLIDHDHPLAIPAVIDKNKFVVVSQGNYVCLHAKNTTDIMPLYEKLKAEKAAGYQVVLKRDMPENTHFKTADDKYDRIGDIMLMAKYPQIFTEKPPVGAHGFSPYEVKDNRATFYAWGPAFKQHMQIAPFENIEVYDVMTQILGLKGLPNDGKGTLAKEILK